MNIRKKNVIRILEIKKFSNFRHLPLIHLIILILLHLLLILTHLIILLLLNFIYLLLNLPFMDFWVVLRGVGDTLMA